MNAIAERGYGEQTSEVALSPITDDMRSRGCCPRFSSTSSSPLLWGTRDRRECHLVPVPLGHFCGHVKRQSRWCATSLRGRYQRRRPRPSEGRPLYQREKRDEVDHREASWLLSRMNWHIDKDEFSSWYRVLRIAALGTTTVGYFAISFCGWKWAARGSRWHMGREQVPGIALCLLYRVSTIPG